METTLVVRHVFSEVAAAWCVPNDVLAEEDWDVLGRLDGQILPYPDDEDVFNYAHARKQPDFNQEMNDMCHILNKERTTWAKYACHCELGRQTVVRVGGRQFPFRSTSKIFASDDNGRAARKVADKVASGRYVITRCIEFTHDF